MMYKAASMLRKSIAGDGSVNTFVVVINFRYRLQCTYENDTWAFLSLMSFYDIEHPVD